MTRILLVEDDLDVRMMMEHVLVGAGYAVTTTESVANALALLDNQPFHLVLVDVKLVDGSGLDVAQRAQELGVKTLVVTAYGLQLPRDSLERFDYLLKPIRPQELIDAIRRVLKGQDGEADVIPLRPN